MAYAKHMPVAITWQRTDTKGLGNQQSSVLFAWQCRKHYVGTMKTTVDIPDAEIEALMRFTRAATKREAIVTAIADYNRRRRMAALVGHAGQAEGLVTADDLQAQRRRGWVR
jgi:hypothetical protein